MTEGLIVKALSGFYYVQTETGLLECKARGRFRLDGTSPLVGDRVLCSLDAQGRGRIDRIEERRNWFIRPTVANIDALVFVAANSNPVTDPFLIDRVSVIAEDAGCELIICLNKTDLNEGEELFEIFSSAGFPVIRTSAETGEGVGELRAALRGKISEVQPAQSTSARPERPDCGDQRKAWPRETYDAAHGAFSPRGGKLCCGHAGLCLV